MKLFYENKEYQCGTFLCEDFYKTARKNSPNFVVRLIKNNITKFAKISQTKTWQEQVQKEGLYGNRKF